MKTCLRTMVVCAALLCACVSVASAQDLMASARQLYGSAAYDEALGVLERLKSASPSGLASARDVEEYRALYLLALGRQVDAERAIESVVAADPTFRPDEQAASPRVVAAFAQVRKRMIPVIAQQRYLAAKAAFERQELNAALAGFEATIQLIDAPDLAPAAKEPPLSDLRTLTAGFRDLARAAAAPPPPPPPPAPEPAAPTATPGASSPTTDAPAAGAPASAAPAAGAAASAAPAPAAPAYYTGDDAGVVPPVAVSQRVPPFPRTPMISQARVGLLEIIISESGTVDSARMIHSVAGYYDTDLLSAARKWKYKPATKDGQPVRFRSVMRINVAAQ